MIQYSMSGYELGTYMEIYLPKKTIYQPFLFSVLTAGFDIEHVKKHFLSQSRRPAIAKFLHGNPNNPLWLEYSDAFVSELRAFFYGYSMYEVDGVFKGSETTQPVIEERTQVLRLLFRVDLDDIIRRSGTQGLPRRLVRARVSQFLRSHYRDKVIEEAETPEERRVFEAAYEWRSELGFFVFGYVIYELCSNIENPYREGRIQKPEDEIWVMHFANLELDRVLWGNSADTESFRDE